LACHHPHAGQPIELIHVQRRNRIYFAALTSRSNRRQGLKL
jgi:hypothetical protein